ncbi:MAG: Asp-tRNA(Asn)/Glu-tRNA(Gln) amidotransferase subunit GatB [Oscillospiraceae bacterium]|jgi:aspartyl-tRNA(Asn)/glutamyl-tRNA(Gln) amidotransferase subunit B|nr:Asp-tRNA(Asn)/Glu-tRNA(Gln) amidotransferase subunit GatB [Oscillospiraceae bacterium]
MSYEMVIGLETHVELSTKSKIFCSCTTQFGSEPNTQCCEVCTGMPGALPQLNRAVVEYAARAGFALNCDVQPRSIMARKHYVYPDLVKAFQISQFDKPLCVGGYMDLSDGRRIELTRIHIEEDPGKLMHVGNEVRIDYNRSGIPLIEIVTEPDFRSIDEVVEYLERLQTTLRAIGVSDCRMQEGSLRCDVNLSLRRHGAAEYGTRSETKNINSFSAIAAAIEYEYERQSEILDAGGTVEQETRSYDADSGETATSRSKENADDYRYFPEPDVVPVILEPQELDALRASLPELPDAKLRRYIDALGVAEADARLLTKYSAVSDYFERAIVDVTAKAIASFIVSTVFAEVTTETERETFAPTVSAERLNELWRLSESGTINRNTLKRVYGEMAASGEPASAFITAEDTAGFSADDIARLCERAIAENAKTVADYRAGKEKAIKSLVGFVMRETKGRADGVAVESELTRQLTVNN